MRKKVRMEEIKEGEKVGRKEGRKEGRKLRPYDETWEVVQVRNE